MENNKLIKYENSLLEKVGNAINVTNKLLKVNEPQFASYFDYLHSKYTKHDLTYFPGDNQLRYEAFSPIFKNLHENKIVYYEKFIGLVKLEDIEITPERFSATAVPYLLIERKLGHDKYFFNQQKWQFSAQWKFMRLFHTHISVLYAGWSVWCDPKTVRHVEELVKENKMTEALMLTYHEFK